MILFTVASLIVLVAVDQITKNWAVRVLAGAGMLPFLPGLLGFRYVENTGAAFSILQGKQTFLVYCTGAALLVLAVWLLFRKADSWGEHIGLSLVLAGGVGNLIDRVRLGYVVDFFDFQFMSFPVFNFADCCVCVGVAVFAIAAIMGELRKKKAESHG